MVPQRPAKDPQSAALQPKKLIRACREPHSKIKMELGTTGPALLKEINRDPQALQQKIKMEPQRTRRPLLTKELIRTREHRGPGMFASKEINREI